MAVNTLYSPLSLTQLGISQAGVKQEVPIIFALFHLFLTWNSIHSVIGV